jgi:PRC-barrel domain
MAGDLWAYPDTIGRLDVTGFEVAAVDGDIGKVDEATQDVDASYIVVDTGMWIFGKKVLLPAGLIDRVDRDEEKVYVDRTKDEIENAPEFDKDNYQGDEYRSAVGGYYGSRAEQAEAERETEEERIADRS